MSTNKELFERIWEHRITNGRENGKWMVYDLTVSGMTASKFYERSKRAGFHTFIREHSVGYLIE